VPSFSLLTSLDDSVSWEVQPLLFRKKVKAELGHLRVWPEAPLSRSGGAMAQSSGE